MEYASGGTLAKLLESNRKKKEHFSKDIIIEYFSQLISGMEAINQYLIHRDIKPDNILFSEGNLKITDFGLSKIVAQSTRTSTFKGFGCYPYLAPEGWRFDKNTIQMDIYSMGFVFYELATLQHPFEKLRLVNLDDWKNAHLFETPPKPQDLNSNLPITISQLILKMIEKSTKERFQNWEEVKESLKKDELPKTSNTPHIDSLLKKRLEKDHQIKEGIFERVKRQNEIEEYYKLVAYQYQKNIYEPLKKFIDEFNDKYEGRSISITQSTYGSTITLISGENITITVEPLIDENFYRERVVNGLVGPITIRELKRPVYDSRLIMAWGEVRTTNSRGFNLLLVKKDTDVYGEWFVMLNTNNPIVAERRLPEPFPFRLNELEEELGYLNITHIYEMSVRNLDLKYFIELIEEFN